MSLTFLPDAAGAHLTWAFQSGQPLIIEVSDDLAAWSPLSPVTESSSGVFEVTDPAAASNGSRFYRAVVP